MRKTLLAVAALAVAGCTGDRNEMPADSPAAALAQPISYGDFAGRWSIQFLGEATDTVTATWDLMATADGSNWTLSPPGQEPIPVRVLIDGDSLMLDAGPYREATARPLDVTTHAVARMDANTLVGGYTSRLTVVTGDSVVRGRLRGTRVP